VATVLATENDLLFFHAFRVFSYVVAKRKKKSLCSTPPRMVRTLEPCGLLGSPHRGFRGYPCNTETRSKIDLAGQCAIDARATWFSPRAALARVVFTCIAPFRNAMQYIKCPGRLDYGWTTIDPERWEGSKETSIVYDSSAASAFIFESAFIRLM